jgi:hypothetical protein
MIRKRATVTVYVLPMVLVGLLLSYGAGSSGAQVAAPDLAVRPPGGLLAPQASVYYVATTGSDANRGTFTRPWRTIRKAADTLQAGDTVYIRAGTYRERVLPQNSGSAGQYITYAAYRGETVTIDGSGIAVPEYSGLFDLAGRSYIVVSGLRVMNSNQFGILADGSSEVLIKGNYTYHTGTSGIAAWGSDHVVIDGNKVELACYNGMQECISVADTNAFEVRNNEVLDCRKEGIDAKYGASNGKIYRNYVHDTDHVGIYIDAFDRHTYNIDVFQNVVHGIAYKDGFTIASEQGGLLENVRIYNNVAYGNGFYGLGISACCPGPASHPLRNIQIVNNTFYNNGLGEYGGGIAVGNNPDVEGLVIRNNICSQNLSFQIAVDPSIPPENYTVDHNLIDGFRGLVGEGEIYGDDYVEGDPLFVNSAGGDLHLQSGSPAIDMGSAVDAPDDDFDGTSRPQDGDDDGSAIFDIGAYEAGSQRVYLPLVLKGS